MPADEAVVRLQPAGRLESLDEVHAAFERLWTAAPDVPATARLAFSTAVAEVVANVIRHAGVPPGAAISLELRWDGDALAAHVVDEGRPYEPGEGPQRLDDVDPEAEHGRGLLMARELATIDYERDDDRNHWRVTVP